jgi:hypothetical protein
MTVRECIFTSLPPRVCGTLLHELTCGEPNIWNCRLNIDYDNDAGDFKVRESCIGLGILVPGEEVSRHTIYFQELSSGC